MEYLESAMEALFHATSADANASENGSGSANENAFIAKYYISESNAIVVCYNTQSSKWLVLP